MKEKISRRKFLSHTSAGGAGLSIPYFIPSGVLAKPGRSGANDRIVMALIGAGSRGTFIMKEAINCGAVIAAVCDVDKIHLERTAKIAGEKVKAETDYRRVLEDKGTDAVIIGTPDHWHALQTVHACQAGKDIYCEKPACNTIAEGQAMIKASKEYHRIVQIGSQGRSHPDSVAACQYIRNGMLGTVGKVTCWHPLNPEGGFEPNREPPAHLDWDMWLGPARWRAFNDAIHPRGFRWLIDLGGGNIRDRGAHIFSVALWFMNADKIGPVSIEALGAPPRRGLYDCPTLMQVIYEFKDPDWTLIWEQPGQRPAPTRIKDYGSKYWGDKDNLWVEGGAGSCITEEKARQAAALTDAPANANKNHMENFMNCVRSREKPTMPIEAAVSVANLCILGNLSYILKRKLQWDRTHLRFIGDAEADLLLSSLGRGEWHL